MAKYTITFDESVKGWTSFHSFHPDWMLSMNNKFYTIKDGQLYEHYDESNLARNNFYGVDYNSEITLIVNEAPSDIKVVKALSTESNKAFAANIRSYLNDESTNITETNLTSAEFINKEGKWYAYLRRNELSGDFTSKSVYGLGEIASAVGSVITFSDDIPTTLLRAGDDLYDNTSTLVGEILSYDLTAKTITVDTTPTLAPGTFLYGQKSGRISGSEIRGYNFEVKLSDNTNTRTELFAVASELFKSYSS